MQSWLSLSLKTSRRLFASCLFAIASQILCVLLLVLHPGTRMREIGDTAAQISFLSGMQTVLAPATTVRLPVIMTDQHILEPCFLVENQWPIFARLSFGFFSSISSPTLSASASAQPSAAFSFSKLLHSLKHGLHKLLHPLHRVCFGCHTSTSKDDNHVVTPGHQ